MNQSSAAEEFVHAVIANAAAYQVSLHADAIEALERYFVILEKWNPRLHLVAPCSPEEFAKRHVLESLIAIRHIDIGARIADIGSGAGLPIIPCLIARPDISATLIESSQKKAVFLAEALRAAGVQERASVVNDRFENIQAPDLNHVTCRALERFTETVEKIADWAPSKSKLLLFGGPSLEVEIKRLGLPHTTLRIPESEQRFLFVVDGSG